MKSFSNLWVLTKFHLQYFLFPRFNTKKDRNKFIILMSILGVAFLIPIISMIVGLYYLIVGSGTDQEGAANLLSALFVMSQLATLFFGVSTYLQVMYLANDKAILSTLPVTSTEIYVSKIITVTVMEMLVSTTLVLPSTIVTGIALANIGVSLSIWYYVLIPVAVITLPLLVILLISVLSFPLMKFYTFLKKHQTVGAILIVVLIAALMLAIYIPLYSYIGDQNAASVDVPLDADGNPIEYTEEEQAAMAEEASKQAMASAMDSIGKFGKYAIHTKALAKSMLGIDAGINFLIYMAITLGALAVGITLSVFLYGSTVQSLEENTGGALANADKAYIETGISKALISREIKTTTRDMGKFINFLMAYMMGPLMTFIMIFIMNMNSKGADEESMQYIMAFSRGFAIAMAIFMVGGANTAASVGMSLEGKSFAILKTLPVNAVDIFKAKLIVVDVPGMVSVTISCIIAGIMTKFNVIDYFGFIITGTIFVMSLNAFGLLRDLKKPKLDWNIIKDITKNNMATLVPLGISLPMFLVSIGMPFVTTILVENEYIGSLIMWGVLLVGAAIYYFALRFKVYDKVERLFEEVEC